MHPFFRSAKSIFAAVLSWIPIVLGAVAVNAIITTQSLSESFTLLIPAMIVEFLICVSIWYICRTFSIGNTNFIITVVKHIISMIFLIIVWLLFLNLYCLSLDQLFNTDIWQKNYIMSLPLLCSIGFFLYFLSCLLYYLVLAVEKVQKTENQILEQKLLTSMAELKSLKAMIQPHFLFNSLTALSKLTISDSERAREVCLMLSDFYRYNLRYSQTEKITLGNELKHVEDYLNIEKMRLGDRLNIKKNIDTNLLHESVFSLLLLPLAENAVKHGIQQCIEGGTIYIRITRQGAYLNIEMSNPYDTHAKSPKGERFGLASLEKRLYVYYGQNAFLNTNKDNQIFTINLKLPLNK